MELASEVAETTSDEMPLGFSASLLVKPDENDDFALHNASSMSVGSSVLVQHAKKIWNSREKIITELGSLVRSKPTSAGDKENIPSENDPFDDLAGEQLHKATLNGHINSAPENGNSNVNQSSTSERCAADIFLLQTPKYDKHPKTVLKSMDNISVEPLSNMEPCTNSASNCTANQSFTLAPVVLHFLSKNETASVLITDEIITSKTPVKLTKSIKKKNFEKPHKEILCPFDEIEEFAAEETNLTSKSGNSEITAVTTKQENISTKETKLKEMRKWAIIFRNGKICIEGHIRISKEEEVLYRTSSVISVTNSGRTVITDGGSRYRLIGKMLSNASVDAGVPVNIASKFVRGFPAGWETYCKRAANLNRTETGSYQGDSSNATNHTHEVTDVRITHETSSASEVELHKTSSKKFVNILPPLQEDLSGISADDHTTAMAGIAEPNSKAATPYQRKTVTRSQSKDLTPVNGQTMLSQERNASGKSFQKPVFRSENSSALPTSDHTPAATTRSGRIIKPDSQLAMRHSLLQVPKLQKKTSQARKNSRNKSTPKQSRKSVKALYTPEPKEAISEETSGAEKELTSAKSKRTKYSKKTRKTAKETCLKTEPVVDLGNRKTQIDDHIIPLQTLKRRSYEIPITPLDPQNPAVLEVAKREKQKRQLGSKKGKTNLRKRVRKENDAASVQIPKEKKSRGTKRGREGEEIARPRKRSRKCAEKPPPEPKRTDSQGSDNVFPSPDKILPDDKKKKTKTVAKKKTVEGEMKWSSYKKGKLKKLVNENLSWIEISETLGFPAEDCEKVYAEMFTKNRKSKAKKAEQGPTEITAKPGTLKHRKQVKQNLEIMKKPKPQKQDLFANDVMGTPGDNIFSSDLFTVPSFSNNFVPVTPNARPPVGFDAIVATPAWFKTPTSSNNASGSGNWTPLITAETPAALKEGFSPKIEIGDKDKKCEIADRVIVQMRKKMMKATLKDTNNKQTTAHSSEATRRKKKTKKNLDLGILSQAQQSNDNDDDDSFVDEYFGESDAD